MVKVGCATVTRDKASDHVDVVFTDMNGVTVTVTIIKSGIVAVNCDRKMTVEVLQEGELIYVETPVKKV